MAELNATPCPTTSLGRQRHSVTLIIGGEPPECISSAMELTDRVVARIDAAVTHLSQSRRTH